MHASMSERGGRVNLRNKNCPEKDRWERENCKNYFIVMAMTNYALFKMHIWSYLYIHFEYTYLFG